GAWRPGPRQPRFGGKGATQPGGVIHLLTVALSALRACDWRGHPPGFLPNAGGLILSAVALGFIVLVASWSASRPSRACPECGGRIPPYGRIAKCPYCGHALS